MADAPIGLQVRPLEEADLDAATELSGVCFRPPWPRSVFEEEVAKASAVCLGAWQGSRFAGYLVGDLILDIAELQAVAVCPGARRGGVGRALVRAFRDRAVERAATRMQLEVRADNTAALRLYAALGFVTTGRRPGYYQDDGEDAVLMDWQLTT